MSSHQQSTPTLAGKKMSSSLRERLKRSSRNYSPHPLKRICPLLDSPSSSIHSTTIQTPVKILPCSSTISADQEDCHIRKDEGNTESDKSSQDFEFSDGEKGEEEERKEQISTPKISRNIDMNISPAEENRSHKKNKLMTKKNGPVVKSVPHFKNRLKSVVNTCTLNEHLNQNKSEVLMQTNSNKEEVEMSTKSFSKAEVIVPKFKHRKIDKSDKIEPISHVVQCTDQEETERVQPSTNENEASMRTSVRESDEQTHCDSTRESVSLVSVDSMSLEEVQSYKTKLELDLKQKEEELRKLRMVKMYRSKNDLCQLQTLISKWRSVCHDALDDLQSLANEPKPSLTQLVQHFGLDLKLLHFNPEEDGFV